MSPVQSVTLRGRFAKSTVRGFAVARRNVYARESIRNDLIMYFLIGFMFQQPDRLQILAENDHFECRRADVSEQGISGVPAERETSRVYPRHWMCSVSHSEATRSRGRRGSVPEVGRSVCYACRGMRDALGPGHRSRCSID